jgi:hypothetical protein
MLLQLRSPNFPHRIPVAVFRVSETANRRREMRR